MVAYARPLDFPGATGSDPAAARAFDRIGRTIGQADALKARRREHHDSPVTMNREGSALS
jgi:hypothetical protein